MCSNVTSEQQGAELSEAAFIHRHTVRKPFRGGAGSNRSGTCALRRCAGESKKTWEGRWPSQGFQVPTSCQQPLSQTGPRWHPSINPKQPATSNTRCSFAGGKAACRPPRPRSALHEAPGFPDGSSGPPKLQCGIDLLPPWICHPGTRTMGDGGPYLSSKGRRVSHLSERLTGNDQSMTGDDHS